LRCNTLNASNDKSSKLATKKYGSCPDYKNISDLTGTVEYKNRTLMNTGASVQNLNTTDCSTATKYSK